MKRLSKYYLLIVVITVLFITAAGTLWYMDMTGIKPSDEPMQTGEILVKVSGAVNSSGVVKLRAGATVEDAISAANGIQKTADISKLDMSKILSAGEEINVPIIGGAISANKVNINTAGKEELCSINGIGEKTAQKIIDFRNKYGPFKSIEDIVMISGIGEGTLAKFKDYITVG